MPREKLFGADLHEIRQTKRNDMLLRFAFGAAISIVAGVGALVLGSTVGGLLLAFPAILPATLTLLEKDQGLDAAVYDVGGAVFGGAGLVAFALTASFSFGRLPVVAVLLVSLAAWTVVALALYVLRELQVLSRSSPGQGQPG